MTQTESYNSSASDTSFKHFHELMSNKVRNILLVSTPYDAWIMEEDGRLSERLVNEYHGPNLSKPPKLTWVNSAERALEALDHGDFDMVITMPRLADANAYDLGRRIKNKDASLPVILLSHGVSPEFLLDNSTQSLPEGIDRHIVWTGNKDLLMSIIKSTEDRMNVAHDTKMAGVRVILFVEDSPFYIASLMPILYQELVTQTLSVLAESLNEEHRLLTMRARPRILVSSSYEQALADFEQFEDNILGVISDVQFPRNGVLDDNAGVDLLAAIREKRFDIPFLLTSSDPANAERVRAIPAIFAEKSSPNLHHQVHDFFENYLAFSDFVFRMPGTEAEVTRAADLRSLEEKLHEIPAESLQFHAERNDFSRWLFTRTEIILANSLRNVTVADFGGLEKMRNALIDLIRAHRSRRQMGVVVNFAAHDVDRVNRFFKIGQGSLGGKARGLAFASWLLREHNAALSEKYPALRIYIPRTLVITTAVFEEFIEKNGLKSFAESEALDQEIAARFVQTSFPAAVRADLRVYLEQETYPLAVRSSSLLEDAQFRAYAGLYRTYMLPNDHNNIDVRLEHLIHAIKLVYASTYFRGAKSFSQRVGRRTEEERMAVIVQRTVGERHGDYFYPAISGVAQSYNYYPFERMKSEEGIATIALGFGRAVVEGEKTLRFSPARPHILPQRASVDALLKNAQRFFYALYMGEDQHPLGYLDTSNLQKREISEAADEPAIRRLTSTYVPQEHRIRDTASIPGHRILTFSSVLKYQEFPLAGILEDVLAMGQEGVGTQVELEFSVNYPQDAGRTPEFALLQLRPMTARVDEVNVSITAEEVEQAFCYSTRALGNGQNSTMTDIVFVKPDVFDRSQTQLVAAEIGRINAILSREGRKYLLIGPGRWGTADRWLGIPVRWDEISAVGAIAETAIDEIQVEPSQGSHFFHNITTLGINYITVCCSPDNFLKWEWLTSLPVANESQFVAHVRLDEPFTLKVDGRNLTAVIIAGG